MQQIPLPLNFPELSHSFGSLRSVRDPSSPPFPRAEIAVPFESAGVEKEPFVVALMFFAHPERLEPFAFR